MCVCVCYIHTALRVAQNTSKPADANSARETRACVCVCACVRACMCYVAYTALRVARNVDLRKLKPGGRRTTC